MISATGNVARIEERTKKDGKSKYYMLRVMDENVNCHDFFMNVKPDLQKGQKVVIELEESTRGYVKDIKVVK